MNIDTYSLSTDGFEIKDDHIECSCVQCEKTFKLPFWPTGPEEDIALDYTKYRGVDFLKKLITHTIEDLTTKERKIVFSLAEFQLNKLSAMSCCQKCFYSYLTYLLSTFDLHNICWAEQILSSESSTDEYELMGFILTQCLLLVDNHNSQQRSVSSI